MKKSIVGQKSYDFALRIIKLYKFLIDEKKEFVLAKQVLRARTSIGANLAESAGAQSDKDFLSKISIAYKEARETEYWISLLKDSEIMSKKLASSFLKDLEELLKIMGKIQVTMKEKIRNS